MTFDPAEREIDEQTVFAARRSETARVVLGLPDWPHRYVSTGSDRRVSVSVAGDLTRDEPARIAGSLRPVGD